jgi:hypothetical protein
VLGNKPGAAEVWVGDRGPARPVQVIGMILICAGAYGAVLGGWRAPEQAFYAGIKLPLVLFVTAVGNGLINALLAPLLGVPLRFGQALKAILLSFGMTSLILGSFSPVLGFLILNSPSLGAGNAGISHSLIQAVNFAVLAMAGVTGNLRLWQYLRTQTSNPAAADRLLAAWLITNLLLGSQVAWILRPFVGSPGLPVEFIRDDAWQGSFFGSLLYSLGRLVSS